jgi:polyribonucleotide nucleotidyltransferase
VQVTLLSSDKKNWPDALACLAAASAIAVSNIPFNGPVSEVRVARIDGQLKINPDIESAKLADIDLMVAGTERDVLMVEGEMKEVAEADMVAAIKHAHETIKKHCAVINELAAMVPKAAVKRTYEHEDSDPALQQAIHDFCYQKFFDLAMKPSAKEARSEAFSKVKEDFLATMSEEDQLAKKAMLARYFKKVQKEAVRRVVLDHGVRLDGRKTTDIRPIWGE